MHDGVGRELGYDDHSAITLGLAKTGWIISAAGLVMAIAFGGACSPCLPSAQLPGWLPGWLASLTVEDHLAARVVCVVNVPMC